jgi:hypothetical protein
LGSYSNEELSAVALHEFCGRGYEQDAKFSNPTFESAIMLKTKVVGIRKLFTYAKLMARQ